MPNIFISEAKTSLLKWLELNDHQNSWQYIFCKLTNSFLRLIVLALNLRNHSFATDLHIRRWKTKLTPAKKFIWIFESI